MEKLQSQVVHKSLMEVHIKSLHSYADDRQKLCLSVWICEGSLVFHFEFV